MNDQTGEGAAQSRTARAAADDHCPPAGLPDEKYRRLVEHSPVAIWVHVHGVVVYANDTAVQLMAAQSRDQLAGHRLTDFIHPASLPDVMRRVAALRSEGDTSAPGETTLRRLDGSVVTVDAAAVLTRWEGKPAIQAVFRDVSDREPAEATLRHQAALVNHVTDAVVATTPTGIVTSWNPAAEAIYGRPAAQVLGLAVSHAVGGELDPAALVAAGGITHTTHRAADRSPLSVRVSAARMDDGFVLVCTDQTALRRAERHFETVVRSLEFGVVVVDSRGRIESANPAALRIAGMPPLDQLQRYTSGSSRYPMYDAEGLPINDSDRPSNLARRTREPVNDVVIGVDRPDGQRVWLSLSCRLFNPLDPEHSPMLISFTDITEHRSAHDRLVHQATHDPLTGLPNRTQVLTHVADALESDDEHRLAAVLFIDLDNFKVINDSLGHHVGDNVLQIVAGRLRHAVRTQDVVARIGGDEFVVLLAGPIERDAIDHLANRLQDAMFEPIVIADAARHVGASIGIVEVHRDERREADEILHDADRAMYRAKTTTRGKGQHGGPASSIDSRRAERRAPGRRG